MDDNIPQSRIIAIAFAAALASCGAHARLATGAGLKINGSSVYVQAKPEAGHGQEKHWENSSMAFKHGNATLRLNVDNPTGEAQELYAEIPFEMRRFGSLVRERSGVDLVATAAIPANGEKEWDISLPNIGEISFDHIRQTVFTDSSGQTVNSLREPPLGGQIFDTHSSIYRPGKDWDADKGDAPAGSLLAFAAKGLHPSAIATENAGDLRALCREFSSTAHGMYYPGDGHAAARGPYLNSHGAWNLQMHTPDFSLFRRWQDISVYAMCMIAEEDWPALPGVFREKILPDWIAAGGCAVFLESADPAQSAAAAGAPLLPAGPFALGRVIRARKDALDWKTVISGVESALETLCHTGALPRLVCDVKAKAKIAELKQSMPFMMIIAVLFVFSVFAGPVALGILKRKNKRINILWVFPLASLAFSAAVGAVIVFVNGVDPELYQYAYTIVDEKAGKAATVQHDVILAPFPLDGPVEYPAAATISYSSGNPNEAGQTILHDGVSVKFTGGWAPAMWPVSFRTVTVRDVEDAADGAESFVTLPLAGRLQSREVDSEIKRRAAK